MKKFTTFTALALMAIASTAQAQTMSSRIGQPNSCYGAGCYSQSTAPQAGPRRTRAGVKDLCSETRLNSYLSFVEELRDFVTPYEYADILVPIRQKALKTVNTLEIYGVYHAETHKAFLALIKGINDAQEMLDNFSHIEAFYPIINDINFVTMSLERSLYN